MKKSYSLILLLGMIVLSTSCTDYEKTISTDDLTKGSWYMENSELEKRLDNYMESRGMYDNVYRELQFIGDGKSGSVNYYETVSGNQSCRSEGRYLADASSGTLKITISGLENSYCSYVKELNGEYKYKYMLMGDIDPKYNELYSGKKTLTISKGGQILFQKDKK
ncbi:hypothetical protein [Algoriphagus sanaruensis]|uniref:Lipocalin-like domain-containing protein n=1 Tax=Algoriphagus sanaruensis TaxID=1727163 RepID=A0A142EK96_9BACT|nr:hypothetical protein [Algoriphagus sanaruensis]AMQ55551.1 hypothetical protein AO498_03985 [Algoriphagus sanaruensis]